MMRRLELVTMTTRAKMILTGALMFSFLGAPVLANDDMPVVIHDEMQLKQEITDAQATQIRRGVLRVVAGCACYVGGFIVVTPIFLPYLGARILFNTGDALLHI